MKYLIIFSFVFLQVGTINLVFGQTTSDNNSNSPSVNVPNVTISTDNNVNQTKVRSNTKKFDPSYFSKPENRHYVLEIRIDSLGKVNPVRVTAVAGKMPYKSKSGGPVKLTLKGSNNEVIDSYYLEDPTSVRVCEDRSGVMPGKAGLSAFIPLPRNSKIAKIEFEGALIQPEKLSLNIANLVRQAGK